MTVLTATVELTKASYRVLHKNPRLMWFPVLSMLSIITVVAITVPIVIAAEPESPSWLAVFTIVFAAQLTSVFFQTALTRESLQALRGEAPSVAEGLSVALSRWSAILSYTAITATIGFTIGLIGRTSRTGIRIARRLVNTVWSLVTYLAIPVMVQERRGGYASLVRSGQLFRQTWGETALAEVGMRVLTAHLSLLLLVLCAWLIYLIDDSAFAIILIVAAGTALIAVVGALEAIYRSALYVFAAEGVVPDDFATPELDDVWRVK